MINPFANIIFLHFLHKKLNKTGYCNVEKQKQTTKQMDASTQSHQNIPTGILRYGNRGEQLLIKDKIEKLVIVVLETKEQTISQHADKIWIIKLCHAVFMRDVTDAFRQMNCTEVVFNFGKIAVEHEYKFDLLKHLPKNVEKITIMNCMSYLMGKFDEYQNIKSLRLCSCPNIKNIYANVLQTEIEEVIIQDGATLTDEHWFSNSKILLFYRESETVATPKVEAENVQPKTGLSYTTPVLPKITSNSSQYVANPSYAQNYWSMIEQRNRRTRANYANDFANPYANEFWSAK